MPLPEKSSPATAPQNDFRLAKSEARLAIWSNVVLAAFKFFVGFFTGSIAILADAWHTLSDSLSSVVMLFGVKISEKPADAEHPFGHGRAELIAAVIIAVMLAAVGVEFVRGGIEKIFRRETAEFGALAYAAMISTIVIKEGMAQYAFHLARKTGLTSLRADGFHHRSDAVSSLVVLAGMVAVVIFGEGLWWMDGALGTLVGLMLLRVAWTVLREAADKLLGKAVPAKTKEEIKKIATRISGRADLHLHHFHLHEYGTHAEITFHLRLAPETTLIEAHALGTEIERAIAEELRMEATIHLEPIRPARP